MLLSTHEFQASVTKLLCWFIRIYKHLRSCNSNRESQEDGNINSSSSNDTRYCEQELRLSTYTLDISSVTQPFVVE